MNGKQKTFLIVGVIGAGAWFLFSRNSGATAPAPGPVVYDDTQVFDDRGIPGITYAQATQAGVDKARAGMAAQATSYSEYMRNR